MSFKTFALVCSLAVCVVAQTAAPNPHEPDTAKSCNDWIEAFPGDDCNSLASAAGIPLAAFLSWNPALARNCTAKDGYQYCMSVTLTPPSVTTTKPTITAKPTTTTPCTYPKSSVCPTPWESCNAWRCAAAGVPIPLFSSFDDSGEQRTCFACPGNPTAIKTTLKTTTTKPPPPPAPTLDVSQFNPAGKPFQCVQAHSPIPSPFTISAGSDLGTAIGTACQNLVGTAKFLEKGDPYRYDMTFNNHKTSFQLQILKGGFSLTNKMCIGQLTVIKNSCATSAKTLGGCSFTSDYNLKACVFP